MKPKKCIIFFCSDFRKANSQNISNISNISKQTSKIEAKLKNVNSKNHSDPDLEIIGEEKNPESSIKTQIQKLRGRN